MKIIRLLLLSVFIFSSCDVIDEDEFFENTEFDINSIEINRKVLLMEMTAIYCPNCPDASAEAERIINRYQGNVIGLNLHASTLANPKQASDPRFRNPDSDNLHGKSGFPPLPVGFIDSYADPIDNSSNFTGWEQDILSQLAEVPNMEIGLAISSNESGYSLDYEIDYTSDQLESERLVVFLTEDDIIGIQQDGQDFIPDYVHKHVSRGSITGTDGINIYKGFTTGDKATGSVNIELDDAWIPENINVIAFIYDLTNNHVMQVEEVHLVE